MEGTKPDGVRLAVLTRFALAAILACAGCIAQEADAIARLYRQGEEAARKGNLAGAEKAWLAVLKEVPQDVGSHANLGVVYMREKDWPRALAELETARKLAPQVAGIRLNIGLANFRQGSYGKAIPPFETVMKDEPANVQAGELLGLCYFFEARYANAVGALEGLWAERGGDLNYLYVLALAAGKAGRHDLEEKATGRLMEAGKDSAELHLILGKAYLSRDEDEKALEELGQAERIDARLPFVHYNLGVEYRRKGEMERAKAEFLKDREIEPEVAYNYDELGAVCAALNETAAAKRYFLEAVRRDGRLAASWYGLAKIYKTEKNYAEAMRALERSGKLDDQSASVHYLRAQVMMVMGDKAGAQTELAEVRRLQKATADRLEQEISGTKYRDPQMGEGK